jgi:predicted cupin superfamily sugar epimerase
VSGVLDPSGQAARVIAALDLRPHPEGGHYRETWRDAPVDGVGRGVGTAILFLLAAGEQSHWHRVDADELWLWQGGSALRLRIEGTEDVILGPDIAAGQVLQALVPRGRWQAAVSLGGWTLVGCVVAPAFRFEGFELAPDGWAPEESRPDGMAK